MSRLGFLAGVVSLLGVSGSAWGSIEITEQLLTVDLADDIEGAIAGDDVLFTSDRQGTLDVIRRDAMGVLSVVAGGPGAQTCPDANDDFFILEDNSLGDLNIAIVSRVSGLLGLATVDPAADFAPAVSGQNIVFVSDRQGSDDIFLYSFDVGLPEPITLTSSAFEGAPAIDGDLVAWEVFEAGDINIMATRLGQAPFAVSTTPGIERTPSVSGDRIAYIVDDDVEVFNVVTQERTRVTSDAFVQRAVKIFGDIVAWSDDRNGNNDIFLYDFVDQQRYQVTSNPANDLLDDLGDERLVFTSFDLGNFDISEVRFSINHPPVADAGNDQSVLVGDTVTLQGSATDIDGDSIVSWAWTVDSAPEGSVATIVDPTIPNPTFMPDLAGQYVFNLVVNDGRDDSAVASVTIEVAPTPASAQVPFSIGFIPVLVILTLGLGLRQVN